VVNVGADCGGLILVMWASLGSRLTHYLIINPTLRCQYSLPFYVLLTLQIMYFLWQRWSYFDTQKAAKS